MDRLLIFAKSIKPAYKELNKKSKIMFWICLMAIGVVIILRYSVILNIYKLYSSEDLNSTAEYIVNSLRWLDAIILVPIAIVIISLLTSRKRMDLEEIRIQYKPVIDSENDVYQDMNIGWLFIENDGEKEFLQDLSSSQELEYGKKYTNNRVLIDCLLGTQSNEYIITKLKIKWQYLYGVQCSTSTAEALQPILTWHVRIEVDPSDSSVKEKIIELDPALNIRPGESFIGVGNFNIELQYILTNKDYHPCADWDILYSITLIDHKGKEYELICNRNWRSIPANKSMI